MIPHKTKCSCTCPFEGIRGCSQELENKREERAQLAYERKQQLNKLRVKAEKKPRCICLLNIDQ
ncbi:hypothetical protein Pyn_40189 [Prunus yedoensis var. nudiflora]|uniref:Uncharacterized protein n=1 Tax=Prunus yedoensis var. nudiflora TaxID=2094558 RepID=A0A314YQW3_PRUYE|nr:hypothetical protein Pyn_40189 [Prunus yedoensis var. nudiflora]